MKQSEIPNRREQTNAPLSSAAYEWNVLKTESVPSRMYGGGHPGKKVEQVQNELGFATKDYAEYDAYRQECDASNTKNARKNNENGYRLYRNVNNITQIMTRYNMNVKEAIEQHEKNQAIRRKAEQERDNVSGNSVGTEKGQSSRSQQEMPNYFQEAQRIHWSPTSEREIASPKARSESSGEESAYGEEVGYESDISIFEK